MEINGRFEISTADFRFAYNNRKQQQCTNLNAFSDSSMVTDGPWSFILDPSCDSRRFLRWKRDSSRSSRFFLVVGSEELKGGLIIPGRQKIDSM